MKSINIVSGLMAVVLFTVVPGIGFAANEDPLFCLCVPVGDDAGLLAAQRICEEETVLEGYSRSRLRAPKLGETFETVKSDVATGCNVYINGTAACEVELITGGAAPSEPNVCTGAPSIQ